jgi:signal transduction histidine kinase
MTRVPYQRSQRVIIWPLGLLPLLLAFAAYRVSSQHIASVEATLATDEFIRSVDEVLSTVQQAEAGQRGYLLTGGPEYLTPFTEARGRIKEEWAKVAASAARNGAQGNITQLHRLIEQKMSELQETIDLRQRAGLVAALAIVKTGRGRQRMLEIQALVDDLKGAQTATFQRRIQQQRRSQLELDVVLAIGVGLGFLLVFLSYKFNFLYGQERDRIEEEIRDLNETLETRVKERTQELEARTKELERRSGELQRSNADLSQFAYVASHDLQEPLRMIGSYMGLLARRYQGKLDETADTYIEFAVSGAQRMQALINDLLTYSQAGTQAIEKEPVSSGEIVKRALTNLDLAIRESSALVRYEDLPIVDADATKLTQVMQNLIGNGIKFRKPDVPPEISVTATKVRSEWVFAIADNGVGFDVKYSDRIFQVFQRLHGVGKYPGNGIGLAICRRIIEHHGGRLWAESELGVGSTFFFTLPFRSETAKPKSEPIKSEDEADASQLTHVGTHATVRDSARRGQSRRRSADKRSLSGRPAGPPSVGS